MADVSQIDPILAKLNECYSGTPLQREKLELWSLLRDIAASLARGDVAELEVRALVAELAEGVAGQLAAHGKALSPEKLADELLGAVKDAAARAAAERTAAVRERLRRAGEKAREKRERLSVL